MLRLVVLLLSLGVRGANASDCVVRGPQYQLRSDTVEWQMRTRVGQSCRRGIRFETVVNPVIEIISPPRSGEFTLQGPSFSYTAGADFGDEDSFTVEVSGSIGRVSGTSTIHVVVSLYGAPPTPTPTAPAVPNPPPAPHVSSVDNKAPTNDDALPLCPVWDWSKGSPPPMRPPFDRSKLYCPPPPFRPPNPPIGCFCSD
jgi:hypothetical protein